MIKAGKLLYVLRLTAETSTSVAPARPVEGVDVDKIAEYQGKPLFNLELEQMEEKPWRKPGTSPRHI